ncbi:CpxP family protein [Vibrio sp. TH_r3]|uniref:CpxP family protein n=1 Tax=Vibrio sp. TH_r3 TaxID=3082084 RepID=UPI0029529C95|nr:CpxP family protein [Vibrio sp. TH_r3]MDV7105478.1 CpxP family protein [Vibrio sp. TH_r3]
MKLSKKIIIAAAALPMVFATTSAIAKGGHDMDGKKQGSFEKFDKGLIRQLDLTEEQKDQLRDLRQANRDENKTDRDANRAARMAEMQAQRSAVQDLVLADDFDQAKAEQLAKAMVEKQAERRVQQLEKQHEMLSVLTADQKEQLKELQAERMQKMSERMNDKMNKGKNN